MTATYIPGALLIYGAVHWFLNNAATRKAKLEAGNLVFDATLPLRLFLGLVTVGFGAGSLYCWFIHPFLAGAIVYSALAVGGIFAIPSVITVAASGVTESSWWGRTKTITWSDIGKIVYHQGPATTVITSKNGKSIAHSGFHRDSELFRAECLKHARVRLETKQF